MIRHSLSHTERGPAWPFMDAIGAAYARLNKARAAEYETELVPLSDAADAPKVPQYLLPLDKPRGEVLG